MKNKDKRNKANNPFDGKFDEAYEKGMSAIIAESTPNEANTADYQVLQDESLDKLTGRVFLLMRMGYRPVGGATYCPKMGIWYQTILREQI